MEEHDHDCVWEELECAWGEEETVYCWSCMECGRQTAEVMVANDMSDEERYEIGAKAIAYAEQGLTNTLTTVTYDYSPEDLERMGRGEWVRPSESTRTVWTIGD